MSDDMKAWVVKDTRRARLGSYTEIRIVIGARVDAEKLPWDGAKNRAIEGPYNYTIAIKP